MCRRLHNVKLFLVITTLFFAILACSSLGGSESSDTPAPQPSATTSQMQATTDSSSSGSGQQSDATPTQSTKDQPTDSSPTTAPPTQPATQPTSQPQPNPPQSSRATAFGPLEDWTKGAYIGEDGNKFADVDGDGLADAIAVDFSSIFVRLSNGSEFPLPHVDWTSGTFYGTRQTSFADVTGDGVINSGDIVKLIGYVFLGESYPPCPDHCGCPEG